jgi:large subunit ribosomal protein L23
VATNPAQYYPIVKKPLMTEKTTVLQDLNNQYTFKVHRDATKPEIRKAVETLFKVKVKAVNVITVPAKTRRVLGRPGRSPAWKKAVVTLHSGNTIDLT